MKKKAIGLVIGIILPFFGYSQEIELPLLYQFKSDFLHQTALNKDSVHSDYPSNYGGELSDHSRVPYLHVDTLTGKNWWGRKIFHENLIILNKKNIYLTVDPLFNLVGGRDFADSSTTTLYQNTRGIKIEGILGEKIIFSTSFLENQARFPSYMTTFIENNGVVPGMGRVKDFNNQDYDYAMATASITWNATSFLRIKLGNDKDFIGSGYRSILLSDNAFNYPHLKMDFWFAKRKLKYTLNYAVLQDLIRLPDGETPESLFERKLGAFHYLSYMPSRKITIGIYGGTLFKMNPEGEDASFYFNAFNPIILFNPIVNYNQNINKIGLNFSWEIWEDGRFFMELATDPNDGESAWLAGFSTWDLLIKGLDLNLEYSQQGSSRFADISGVYSHYSQSLAHTLGSGFQELYIRLNYRYKRIQFFASLNYSERKLNDAESWGFINSSDISVENYGDGKANSTQFLTELSYIFNPKTNMNVALGYQVRRSRDDIFGKTDYLYLAFRTSIFNEYRDF